MVGAEFVSTKRLYNLLIDYPGAFLYCERPEKLGQQLMRLSGKLMELVIK